MTVTIVTGASQNHFKTLCQFLRTIPKGVSVYVYDLGLDESSSNDILREFKDILHLIFRKFDYSQYPSYFNINVNAGEYAWKPVIIEEVSKEVNGVLIWMDAGTKIIGSLEPLINIIREQGIYSPVSSGNVSKWTHIETQRYFDIQNDEEFLNRENRAGGILGYNLENNQIKEFIQQMAEYARIKECIAPEGSSRDNHRQDQAVFTILYYKYFGDRKTRGDYISFSVHNDID